MPYLSLKPNHKVVQTFYKEIKHTKQMSFVHEGTVAPHFAALLRYCGSKVNWQLIEQYPIQRKGQHPLKADGALLDEYKLVHGLWEAKDTKDDLPTEVKKKFQAGYPQDNILFQAPDRAILVQNGSTIIDTDLAKPEALVDTLKQFFDYQPPAYEQWGRAVDEFKDQVPQLAQSLLQLIEEERKYNPKFVTAFNDLTELVKQAINPNISLQAVEEMLIQHLLTERIFRKVFNNPDFANRNIIAIELEKVIQALTARHFSRNDFLGKLDRFYGAIETTAATIDDFAQKQGFLNTVYEKFFQGFSVKVADTHGIVYTPQPIVDFMVRSVDDILHKEFGQPQGLASKDVHILDPFVGTGNFILRIMRQIPKTQLPHKYAHELHCNEVMLLPYYIAAMNIEHEYLELTGQYAPFEGICLVDTFELAEGHQIPMFAKENTYRVEQQKHTPIFVVIGNPPYNVGQVNQNDNNKNRKYGVIDKRVAETYSKNSNARNKNALSDVYVKAFRWASDRIGDEGVISFITNSSFIDKIAFDGMRKHLREDFGRIYVLDLKGDIRRDSMRDGIPLGEQHTVFGLSAMVGIAITFLVKGKHITKSEIFYSAVDFRSTRNEKFNLLETVKTVRNIKWREIHPNEKNLWLTEGIVDEYNKFIPMGNFSTKQGKEDTAVFGMYARGSETARDVWAYNFGREILADNMKATINVYNEYVIRYDLAIPKPEIDNFVTDDSTKISWSRNLKRDLRQRKLATFAEDKIRRSVYRPFTKRYLFFDRVMNQEVGQLPYFFPKVESKNLLICVVNEAQIPFSAQITDCIPALHYGGRQTQCFPFYTYNEDGTGRRENITDWALAQFRAHYAGQSSIENPKSKIEKWDIFYYVYGLLHHPAYRETYAANLRRELPRLPYAPDFWGFAQAGQKLAKLHVEYEQQPQYPLKFIETPGEPLNWRVEKMRLSKDKTQLKYNDFLTLAGIPAAAFDYRLGNRSALDWVIDQYQIKTDSRSGITNDPNNLADPQYIVRLVGQVITVSLETVQIVNALPPIE